MTNDAQHAALLYKVIANQDQHYSIQPAHVEVPAGWGDTGKRGTPVECAAYIAAQVGMVSARTKPGVIPDSQAEQSLVVGPVPLLPTQHWFLEQNLLNPHHWNMATLLEITSSLVPDRVEQVVRYLFSQHDALRAQFVHEATGWKQFLAAPAELAAPVFLHINLSALSEAAQEEAIEAKAIELHSCFDLSRGPLMKIALFDLGAQRPQQLLMIFHRLVCDTFSRAILLEDFQIAYQQLGQGRPITSAPKTTSIRQWTECLTSYAQSAELRREVDYWLGLPWSQVGPLPVDYPDAREANTWASVDHISASLSEEETQTLLYRIPKIDSIETREILLTVLAQVCMGWKAWPMLLVSPLHLGRPLIFDDMDLSRTAGCFTINHTPVLLDLRGTSTPIDDLKAIREQLRRFPNQGFGYSVLRYFNPDQTIVRALQDIPRPEIYFCYWSYNQSPPSGNSDLFREAHGSDGLDFHPEQRRPWLIYCSAEHVAGRLKVSWEYSKKLHRRASIEQLAEEFVGRLRTLISILVSAE